MKKSTVLFLLIIIFSDLFAGTRYYRAAYRDDPSTTIVIAWCDNGTSTGATVYYGTTDFGSNSSLYPLTNGIDRTQSESGLNHRFARLTGLQPGTTYYFVIKDQEGTSQRMSFKTLSDNANQPVCFISGGDTRTGAFLEYEYQQCRPRRQEGNKLVAKIRPDFVAFSGDFVFLGSDSEWNDWFSDWELAIGPEETKKRLTPIIVVFGNHEANSDLYNMFDIPNANNYFALNIGGNLMRLYNLNTDLDCDGTQLDWFTNDLQLYTGTNYQPYWKAIQYHIPLVPHGEYSTQTSLIQCWATLFPQYGIRLSMDGHTHVQKITYPISPSSASGSQEGFIQDNNNGTVFIGEGCWGAPMRELYTPYSWTRASARFPGFFVIDVSKSKIAIRTVKFENVANVGQVTENNPTGTKPSGLVYWNINGDDVVYIYNNIPLSNDASLASLNVTNSTLDPIFNSTTYNYSVKLPAGTTTVPIATAVPNNINANVNIIQAQNLTGSITERTATVIVTAENETTQHIYTIEFIVEPASDALLLSLESNIGALNPTFSPNIFNYNVILPFANTSLPIINATANDPQANVTISQTSTLTGQATIVVTSADNTQSNTYVVQFNITPNNAKEIISFSVQGQLGQSIIDNQNLTIHFVMPLSANLVSITPIINYVGINLSPASGLVQNFTSPVEYTITAADNSTAVYTVSASIQSVTDNANLANLWTDIGELLPVFNSSILNYSVNLPINTENITIFAQTEDASASKYIYPPTNLMGTLGERTGVVLVVAANGINTKSYNIVFTGANSIEPNEYSNYLNVFPNPTKGVLNLRLLNEITDGGIEIYNGLGHLLNKFNIDPTQKNYTLNFENYNNGAYYLFLKRGKEIKSYKIIKN